MVSEPIRVLCVEDNQLVAEAIARKLHGHGEFEWLGWVNSAAALTEKITQTCPTVVCMDLDIPGEDTFAMVRSVGERCPAARVLMLTGHVRQDYIDRALSAGAWGYLSKGEESRVIIDGIRRVAAGEFVLGTIARDGFHGSRPNPQPPAAPGPPTEPAPEPRARGVIEVLRRVIRKPSSL